MVHDVGLHRCWVGGACLEQAYVALGGVVGRCSCKACVCRRDCRCRRDCPHRVHNFLFAYPWVHRIICDGWAAGGEGNHQHRVRPCFGTVFFCSHGYVVHLLSFVWRPTRGVCLSFSRVDPPIIALPPSEHSISTENGVNLLFLLLLL